MFVVAMTLFGCNALKCASMNNQKWKARPGVIIINSNDLYFILTVLK